MKHHLRVEPYKYQEEGMEFGLEKKRLLIGDEPGLGKSQSLDSLLSTPNGFIRMKDVYLGQEIFGQNGEIYNVIGIFPQGKLPVYAVTFSDNTTCECSLDHLWNVRDSNRRLRGKGWITKTLKDILDSGLTLKSNHKRGLSGRKPILKWEIPICSPVDFPKKIYDIPPYTMGVLIGDGSLSKSSHVSLSLPKEKQFIIDKIQQELNPLMSIKRSEYNNISHYIIVNSDLVDRCHTTNMYMKPIREFPLDVVSKEKFIPTEYLQGNVDQRKDLLQGLMDSDGSCIKNRTVFHSTSLLLAEDVKELVESLGGVAIIHYYNRSKENESGEYQVNIRLNFCPFSINGYKSKQWNLNSRFKVTRYIKDIKYIGNKECQCIKTSAPDELYLTNDYIVTHNTLQSIGIVDTADAYPCLVICPSSLKINWQREFEKFTDKNAVILDNAVRTTWPYLLRMKMYHVAVVNYESLRKYFVWDIKGKKSFRLKDVVFCPQIQMFKSVIIDECHRTKDPSAQQTIFTKGITTGKEWIVMLSGTPVVNRPEDLITQLSIMGRLQEFGGRAKFVADFCTDPKDKDAEPAVPLSELSRRLYNTCMIRREKAKVLTQLPDKTRMDVYVDISNEEEYRLAEADLASYLKEYTECTDWEIRRKMRMEALVKFMTLRRLATLGKIAQSIDFIKTFIDNGSKLIVFCSLHDVVDTLLKAFPCAVTVTGRDSQESKQAAVDSFQTNSGTRLIICSIKAAGVGLTLTASSSVAFLELPWTFADACQCEDRAHRIGQKDNVTCYYLLGKNTIDFKVYKLINDKKNTANQIMNSSDDIPTDEVYFDELVSMFINNDKI